MNKKASNRIKAVLAEKGKTNNWLAETLEKNRTTVSKWCTNQMQPTVETLFEIAEALDVDVRDLLVSTKP
jgi:DNA-binding XRE family transcriptional regulator